METNAAAALAKFKSFGRATPAQSPIAGGNKESMAEVREATTTTPKHAEPSQPAEHLDSLAATQGGTP